MNTYRTKPLLEEYMQYIQGDYSGIGVVLSALLLLGGYFFYSKSAPQNKSSFYFGLLALAGSMLFFSALDAALYFHTYSAADKCWGCPPVMKTPYALCAYRIVQTTVQHLLGLTLLIVLGWQYALVFYVNHGSGLYDLIYYGLLKQPFHWSGYDYYWLSWTFSGWFGLREGYHVIIFCILVIILSVLFLYYTYRRKYA